MFDMNCQRECGRMGADICAGVSALFDCLPGMTFTLLLFRKRFRFGLRATIVVCAVLAIVQIMVGALRYGHVDDNVYMASMAMLLPTLWGLPMLGLIHDSWRKIVFVLMLFMNLSGTVAVISNAVEQHLFSIGGGVWLAASVYSFISRCAVD